ncbi:MAG: NADH-quinone oxidoreductase subunit L, partial [Phycisphaerales bacterium]|nr:NADH-quinone oxidoreductase subunit L [Phycisphaerales bacterium]
MIETLSGSIFGSLLAMSEPHAADPHAVAGTAHKVASEVGHGPAWVLLIPFLPLLGFVLNAVYAAIGNKSKLPAWTAVALLAVAFIAALSMFLSYEGTPYTVHAFDWIQVHWGEKSLIANFSFYVDKLTILWMLFVTGLATLIALYASEYMSHDIGTGYCRFFAAFGLFVFSMACLVMGDNLLMLYLGWEGVGLCSYLLIGYFYKKPSAVAAAKKAFIVNRIGDLGLALGVYLTFVHFGTLEYATLFSDPTLLGYVDAAKVGDFSAIPATAQWIALLLMVGAFGKSAQFPLYVWLPDAMEGPTPVSALIHAATMVTAGVYLIARMYPVFLVSENALPIVAWIGTITAVLAATIGMAQFDIKRIMAYSTVSQLGYMFAGLGLLTTTGAAFHVLTHAFFKALLFLACGAVM